MLPVWPPASNRVEYLGGRGCAKPSWLQRQVMFLRVDIDREEAALHSCKRQRRECVRNDAEPK
jgi:hypothetical protein